MAACRRFLVAGRVQGVAYRTWAQQSASRLGLTGWARNLYDGRVEVLACGERENLETLRNALSEGPPSAKVTAVDEYPAHEAAADIQSFSVR